MYYLVFSSRGNVHLVNFRFRIQAPSLINLLFKEKEKKQSEERDDDACFEYGARRLCLPFGAQACAADDFDLHWHVPSGLSTFKEVDS